MNWRQDMNRRVGVIEERIEWLDVHGSRGVESLKMQITNLAQDIGEIKGGMTSLESAVQSRAGSVWPSIFMVLAVALPTVGVLITLAVRR